MYRQIPNGQLTLCDNVYLAAMACGGRSPESKQAQHIGLLPIPGLQIQPAFRRFRVVIVTTMVHSTTLDSIWSLVVVYGIRCYLFVVPYTCTTIYANVNRNNNNNTNGFSVRCLQGLIYLAICLFNNSLDLETRQFTKRLIKEVLTRFNSKESL